jgi:tetratricopeptide (TPR) repeat protein
MNFGVPPKELLIIVVAFIQLIMPRIGFALGELPKDDADAQRYTYDYLFMIDALIRHEKYKRAKIELDALLERVKQNPEERALAQQAYGYLSIGVNDYPAAIQHFFAAIDSGALPDNVVHSLHYTLAQLLYQEERFEQGLQQLQAWFIQETQPAVESRVLLAQLYYALQQWKKAVTQLKFAIAEANRPHESWYQMLVGIYLENEQFKQTIPILQTMLKLFPDRPLYWQQLSGVLLHLGRQQQAVAVLSLAAEQGFLDEAGLLRLAKLSMQQNTPLDAAELLVTKLDSGDIQATSDNLNLLVDAWLLARDQKRALMALERLAKIDKSGAPQLRAGRLLIEKEQWLSALSYLKQGIKLSTKPTFDDWLLLGSAYYHLENRDKAISAFEMAQGLAESDKQRKLTNNWIKYLRSLQEEN